MGKLIITIVTVLTATILACNSNEKKTPTTDSLKSMQSADASEAIAASFDHFEVVRPLKQPKSMDCWATALTILYSWKNNDNTIKIEDVVRKYGNNYVILFQTNAGIRPAEEKELYRMAKLTVIQGANPTIATWYNLLKNHGPLSITVDADPPYGTIHALVVNGIKGDGSAEKTFIDYVDPADGKQYNLKFSDFIKLYEGAASWPLQIIYW